MVGGSGPTPSPASDQPSASRSPSEDSRSAAQCQILIVEDNEADVFLIQRALQRAHIPCALQILRNGQEAIQFFDAADVDRAQPCPHLVILDVNLPKRLGRDVLKHMRQTQRCANAQVIIVTTSDSPHDREQMERLGANGYFKKPSDFDEFMKLGEIVKSVLRAGSN